jgi:hypothetical protein
MTVRISYGITFGQGRYTFPAISATKKLTSMQPNHTFDKEPITFSNIIVYVLLLLLIIFS